MRTGAARIGVVLLSFLLLSPAGVPIRPAGAAEATSAQRPDAWIKLCGPRNTCIIQPWHPWRGKNVYNTTGVSQTVSSGVEGGNMIRFWILLQNDGTEADSLVVDGCSGNSAFSIVSVNVGAWRSGTEQKIITSKFKAGTASFAFDPAPTQTNVIVTVRFLANSNQSGVSYSCPITVSSATSPTVKDKVIAKMTVI